MVVLQRPGREVSLSFGVLLDLTRKWVENTGVGYQPIAEKCSLDVGKLADSLARQSTFNGVTPSGRHQLVITMSYSEKLEQLKTETITSSLQLLAQSGRDDLSTWDRRETIETCNRVIETLAGKTSLHRHVSSSSVTKPHNGRFSQ